MNIDEHPEQPIYFRVDNETYNPGEIIKQGRFGDIIKNGISQQGRFGDIIKNGISQLKERELFLEKYRIKHFPEKPSRLNCSFAFPNIYQAMWYRNNFAGRSYIYVVKFWNASAKEHVGNFCCLPCGKLKESVTEDEIAYGYWTDGELEINGSKSPITASVTNGNALLILEVLKESDIQIIGTVCVNVLN